MRKIQGILLLVLGLSMQNLGAQVVDRYPFIQQPTETSAMIAWRTDAAQTGYIAWGESPNQLKDTVWDGAATQKHAHTLSGLLPNTRYWYQVKNVGGDTSEVEYFYTAKPLPEEKLSFLHYGDCGYNNSIQNGLAALMEQEEVDFAVVSGDVDQGDGSDYDDIFFGVYRNMLANECHFTALGNHDIIYDNGATYLDAFYLPTNNPQHSEHYYTFTWGNAKFIALDSNIDYSPGSDQHNFLLDELKCNEHQWLFVFFHHPPWTNAWDPSYYIPFQPFYQYDGNDDMRTELVPYFEQYGVDFVLNGHSHCYQRGEMNGVQYVISGGAGSQIIDQHTCNTPPFLNSCSPNLQVEYFVNHYVRFDLDGDSVSYSAINTSGQVFDFFHGSKAWTDYQLVLNATPASGNSTPDGALSLSVTGPFPPYSWQWSTGDTTSGISGLAPGWYTVSITNGKGCTTTDSIQVSGPVGSDLSLADRPDLAVFPVPFAEELHFEWNSPSAQPFHLELLDLNGRLLLTRQGKGGRATLSTAGLPAGVYAYRLKSGGYYVSGKVLKE
ncbi:MAG: metallophosphoesterase [Bacteroidia bacterium]|nr:metallophosphoesterase [Bacteroidia bacterium]